MTDRFGTPAAASKNSASAPTARRVWGLFDDHERLEEAVSWLEGSLFVRADMALVCECHEPGNGTSGPLGAEVIGEDLQQVRASGPGRALTLADLAAEGLVVLNTASTMAAATEAVVNAVRACRACNGKRAKETLRIAGATRIWTHDPAVGPAP